MPRIKVEMKPCSKRLTQKELDELSTSYVGVDVEKFVMMLTPTGICKMARHIWPKY